jgi:hypothetical protein
MFFKTEPTVRFKAIAGAPNVSPLSRIERAVEVKPQWLLQQRDYEAKDKFANCPGMVDWMQAGYIIPAWTDMRIRANKAGTIVSLHNKYAGEPGPMNAALISGLPPVTDSVKLAVTKISSPWAIFAKAGYSAHVVPALYHSPFLGDLFVYPGTVDYDKFTTVNFIFTATRECDIEIPCGTPLLQVIPFKREPISAQTGKATERENDLHRYSFPTRVRAAYRKFFHQRKIYTLEDQP